MKAFQTHGVKKKCQIIIIFFQFFPRIVCLFFATQGYCNVSKGYNERQDNLLSAQDVLDHENCTRTSSFNQASRYT